VSRRIVPFLVIVLLAGCVSPTVEEVATEPTLVVDPDRPAPESGEVITGPSVGPDLNATTAAAPRLVRGEWWRIQFDSAMDGTPPQLVRVVANVTETGYVVGMPHEGWIKEAISFHSPGFGDVDLNLGYNTHNQLFEPVRFPLRAGDTWETVFATGPLKATVEAADEYTAEISFTSSAEAQPTDPVMRALGMMGDGPMMRLKYDARMHEIVYMESGIGTWSVIEHGYDFQGWVTVPRGEHTAIDYGTLGPVTPGQTSTTRTIEVEGGFNRLTLMHVVVPLGPGSFKIRSLTPKDEEFITEAMATTENTMVAKFYESYNPDGTWTQEDVVIGPGATYTMGIAYHQYDIHLPDGGLRTDHSHPVIR
jgi:hypothetical protein